MHLLSSVFKLWLILSAISFTNVHSSTCPDRCGDVNIPYPFGIGENCSRSDGYSIVCNNTKPLIGDMEIMSLDLESSQIQVTRYVSYQCYYPNGSHSISGGWGWNDLRTIPYRLSYVENVFTAVGCDTTAKIVGLKGRNYTGGCISMCYDVNDIVNNSCSGIGCCQNTIPEGLRGYAIEFAERGNDTSVWALNPCSYGFLLKKDSYNFSTLDLRNMNLTKRLPMVLDWAIGNITCDEAQRKIKNYACVAENSDCYNSTNGPGYVCKCNNGYRGNPYVPDGCQDIDECKEGAICKGDCVNTIGSYTCTCPRGGFGNANGDRCLDTSVINRFITGAKLGLVALSGGIFFVLVIIGVFLIFKMVKQNKKVIQRKRYFLENHGLLLQHLLSSCDDSTTNTRIFTLKEIIKATNNFDDTRIVGRGGHGIVYKGILSDLRVVAIKKSKVVVKSEIEEFINEVAILSQMNHRNIVKLFGCCLESEVPLLVYEFISNGTLSDRFHVWDREFNLSWEERLRIASEVAGAVAYLHFSTSKSIFHRDLKSANILLDDKLTAKVSDFGASKFVMADQSHVTTVVQGTFGYLDPEYFHTGRLTDKSDVYSFGVILVELLTGEKPNSISASRERRNLTSHFLWMLNEKKLFQVIEHSLVNEATTRELEVVSELAESCLRLKGEDRPTMKDVEFILGGLRKTKRKEDGDDDKHKGNARGATRSLTNGNGWGAAGRLEGNGVAEGQSNDADEVWGAAGGLAGNGDAGLGNADEDTGNGAAGSLDTDEDNNNRAAGLGVAEEDTGNGATGQEVDDATGDVGDASI